MTARTVSAVLAAMVAGISAAQACEVPNPLRPELAAITPVVVRGAVTAIEPADHGGAILTLKVLETLRGTEAETWTVAWGAWSVIPPPQSVEDFANRYGSDIVLGLTPDVPGIAVDDAPAQLDAGRGSLAQENCALPFLDSYAALEPLLQDAGLLD